MAIKKLINLGFDDYDYLKIDVHQVVIQPDIDNISIYLKVCKDRDHNTYPASWISYDVSLKIFTEILLKCYSTDNPLESWIACLYTALNTLSDFAIPVAEPVLEEGQVLLSI